MLIGIDSSPCSLSLRNRSTLSSITKCHQNKSDLKIVFVQKSFFFSISSILSIPIVLIGISGGYFPAICRVCFILWNCKETTFKFCCFQCKLVISTRCFWSSNGFKFVWKFDKESRVLVKAVLHNNVGGCCFRQSKTRWMKWNYQMWKTTGCVFGSVLKHVCLQILICPQRHEQLT